MQPLFGPNLAPVLPVTATPALRLADGARPDTGEPAAARLRAEMAERVDPPRAGAAPADARLGARPTPEPPPDPRLPAGPPPAFGQSPLERQRQELREPASLFPEIAPRPDEVPVGAPTGAEEGAEAQTDPPRTDPAPEVPAPDFASGRRALSSESPPSIDVRR